MYMYLYKNKSLKKFKIIKRKKKEYKCFKGP